MSWTAEDLIGLRIKGSPSDRNRKGNVARGEPSTLPDRQDPRGVRNDPAPKKRGKYRAEPTEVDGHRFPSKREAERYRVLVSLLAAGEITDLELQPRFPLHARSGQGVAHVIGEYVADFRYRRKGLIVTEDAKGMKLPLYLWKKKHTELQYGIRIEEV
jgi:hypothetical protein